MTTTTKANIKILFALTLVHFIGDFYSSFVTPLYPLFMEKLGLSLTQIGLISGVNIFLAFIVQPTVGYFADRYATRIFIFIGLLMPVVFLPLSGTAVGFWSLLLVVALGSFGSAMFHPSVTGLIPVYSGAKAGFAMSVFNTGGTLAFGVGPLFITWYATRHGLSAMPLTMLFGLLVMVYLYRTVPVPRSEGLHRYGFLGSLKESLGSVWKAVICIWGVMVIRSVVAQCFMIYMPVFYVQKGFSIQAAGVIFSLFTVAGTFSGLFAGHLSDRIGFKPVFIGSFLLMCPALLLLLNLPGNWAYLGPVLAGGVVLATLPLGVAFAQTLAPQGRSMVASLMMGLAYGMGGVAAPLVGWLADRYFSIHTVLTGVAFLPLLTLPLIFLFPRAEHRRRKR